MPGQSIEMPVEVLSYLDLHHIITLGTASFTGMPHAATIAYVSDPSGVYFAMPQDELTLKNVAANRWASFTIDDYTPDFRKVRELRGVGRCERIDELDTERAQALFAYKMPGMPKETLEAAEARSVACAAVGAASRQASSSPAPARRSWRTRVR